MDKSFTPIPLQIPFSAGNRKFSSLRNFCCSSMHVVSNILPFLICLWTIKNVRLMQAFGSSNNSLWSQPTSESGHGHGQPSSPSPAPLHQHQNPTPLNPSPNPSSSATNGHSSSSITVINHSTHSSSSLHDKFKAPHQSVEYINSIKITYTSQRHFSSASSEGAGKQNESLKWLIAPRIADRRSRIPPSQGGQTQSLITYNYRGLLDNKCP